VLGHGRKRLGTRAEAEAERLLTRQGMRLVARNWSTRLGEIDLVMMDGSDLVFVEVKARSSDAVAPPHETVTGAKRRRLVALARRFIQATGQHDRACRFDVVSVVWSPESRRPQVQHIVDAFPAVGS